MALTDTVTSLAHDVGDTVASLAHDVASKAQDAAAVAGERGKEWGKQAVDAGRSTLATKGVVAQPSHKGRNVLLLVVLAVLGFVAWKATAGRKKSSAEAGSSGDAERIADKNHVQVA